MNGPEMTTDPRTRMTILDEPTCWELLKTAEVARLAIAMGTDLDIFPVNIALDGHDVIFRTGEGTKLAAATIWPRVVLEADGVGPTHDQLFWSVVVKGQAERLDRFSDIYHAEDLALPEWTEHHKQWFVRVRPHEITGRSFSRTPHGGFR